MPCITLVDAQRTVAVFRSQTFNARGTDLPGAIESCLGEDVARWLIERLGASGVPVDAEPGQEDFGWFFNFTIHDTPHCCVVGSQPLEQDAVRWIVWVERRRGFLASLFQLRAHGVLPAAVQAVHRALSEGAGSVFGLRWYAKLPSVESDEAQGALEP
jgi:hypothetical protein